MSGRIDTVKKNDATAKRRDKSRGKREGRVAAGALETEGGKNQYVGLGRNTVRDRMRHGKNVSFGGLRSVVRDGEVLLTTTRVRKDREKMKLGLNKSKGQFSAMETAGRGSYVRLTQEQILAIAKVAQGNRVDTKGVRNTLVRTREGYEESRRAFGRQRGIIEGITLGELIANNAVLLGQLGGANAYRVAHRLAVKARKKRICAGKVTT
jgi:hypothetical protein